MLVCPSLAVPTVAAEHDCGAEDFRVNGKPVHAYLGWNLCYPFNMVSQCPVIAVPSGLTDAGLPTGIQIVGRTYDDLGVFQAAAAYEAANPWRDVLPAALTLSTQSHSDNRSGDRTMTDDLLTRDGRTIADIERIRFFPATTVGGEGSYVIEEGGRRVLDFSASWGAACLGYGHPALAEAVSEAVRNMGAVSLASCAVGNAVGLAEDLLARLPDDRDRRVWFGHAGSDANDAVGAPAGGGDTAPRHPLLRRRLSRRQRCLDVGVGPQLPEPRAGTRRSHAAAVSRPLPPAVHARSGRRRAGGPRPALRERASAGRDRRRLHRADPVGRRPHRAARRLPQGAGGALPRPRNLDRRGRGEGRHGPHRPVPCLRGRGA